jgi:hypothetical protein
MKTKQVPLLALALLIGGCVPSAVTTGNGDREPAKITSDVVKRQDLEGYSFFDGKLVIPETAQATAYSPYDAPVLTVMTGAGKHVGRGEPIVKLAIPGAEDATSAAKANVSAAKSELSTQKGGESDPVLQAKRELADAQAAEKVAKDSVANGNQADVATATQDRVNAEAVLKRAQEELRLRLQPSKDAVSQAKASLTSAKADAAKGIVRAPVSGTVVTLEAQPGLQAKSKQALATIINFDAVRVQGLVPPELKDLVIRGSHVIIAMNGASSVPLEGTVVEVKVVPPTEGQKSPGYLAVIVIQNPKAMAQPNMSVRRIGVKTGSAKNVLVVPVGAITTVNGKSSVKVKSGEAWIDTPVVLGISDGALTEIKSGLTEGASVQVVTQPEKASPV